MTKSPIVGIDLGTTFSLVSVLRDGVPVVLPNAVGELLTPSAVSVTDDGTVLVGAPARARATTHPTRTALAFKRDMGTTRTYQLGDRKMTPPELSALVLGALKRDAEAALGCPIEEAVITVPAYFGDLQRQATRDAGAIAGLKVERIINEPTAAALAYGLHERHREMRAVVLDLGGGTFDVTVLEIIEGVVEIQASAGDARLGGEDFDEALAERFAARAKDRHGWDLKREPRAWARLREAAEDAKKRLSDSESTSIALVDLPLGDRRTGNLELTLTRDEAEETWAPLLDRVRAPITRALRDASLGPDRIDEVLLVGGSTRMPCIARLAAQMFGRLPLRKLPPDEAVAMGAAVQAALKSGDAAVEDMVVTDVAPFTMGIATGTHLGRQLVSGLFSPILERGTVIPASRVERYATMGDMQKEIRIEVFQGEHSLVRDNQKLGEYLVKVTPRPAGEESIEVRFTYDLNGILEVETTIGSTGKKEVLVIEKTPGRMTAADVKAAREAMARLKLHPRDALPNTTALARADALYVELSGPNREELGHAIAMLRAALETQDEKEIAPRRERLIALVSALKRR
ncbi:MAG: Hsp70 family protein [Minicystis sp.]